MRCKWLRQLSCLLALLTVAMMASAEDLHIKKSISVGGNVVSSTETSIKGARTRDVNQGPGGAMVTLRQCDLKRTVTLNDQAQTYLVINDPQDAAAARAAAMVTGAPVPEEKTGGGKIEVTTTITDTGERKQMFGYGARHLKAKIVETSSADACSKVNQTFETDGWYADVSKEASACTTSMAPPVRQNQGCQDAIVEHHSGSGKAGYPLVQNVVMHNPDGSTMTVNISVNLTSLTESRIGPERSVWISSDTEAGNCSRKVGSSARTLSTTATTLVPGCFMIASISVRLPLYQLACLSFSMPS